jgi:hypothetical protein
LAHHVVAHVPAPVIVAFAVVALAGLDLAGTFAAKESVERHSVGYVIAGISAWALAFAVYSWALEYADLAPVTLAWVVALQVGVILLDRYRYGTALPHGWPLVVALILAGQAYLLLGPTGEPVSTGNPQSMTKVSPAER